MSDCYLDIVITVMPEDTLFMLTKVYQVIHGLISNSEEKIGVGFPDWHDHEVNDRGKIIKHGGMGSTIRLFGSSDRLTTILGEPALTHFIQTGCARAYPVQRTPDTTSYVKFTRDRRPEKSGEFYLERRKRRNEHRGSSATKSADFKKMKLKTAKNVHYFNMKSNENGHRFRLFVKRDFCDSLGNGSFSNYGFCKEDICLPNF